MGADVDAKMNTGVRRCGAVGASLWPLTAHEEVAVRDGGAQRVLGLAHVLALVLGEHLDDDERALLPAHVDVDLEVLAGPHRLAVEVPGDGRRRRAAEEHAQHGAIAVRHRLVAQRQREPRRLFLHVVHLHFLLHVKRLPRW